MRQASFTRARSFTASELQNRKEDDCLGYAICLWKQFYFSATKLALSTPLAAALIVHSFQSFLNVRTSFIFHALVFVHSLCSSMCVLERLSFVQTIWSCRTFCTEWCSQVEAWRKYSKRANVAILMGQREYQSLAFKPRRKWTTKTYWSIRYSPFAILEIFNNRNI